MDGLGTREKPTVSPLHFAPSAAEKKAQRVLVTTPPRPPPPLYRPPAPAQPKSTARRMHTMLPTRIKTSRALGLAQRCCIQTGSEAASSSRNLSTLHLALAATQQAWKFPMVPSAHAGAALVRLPLRPALASLLKQGTLPLSVRIPPNCYRS